MKITKLFSLSILFCTISFSVTNAASKCYADVGCFPVPMYDTQGGDAFNRYALAIESIVEKVRNDRSLLQNGTVNGMFLLQDAHHLETTLEAYFENNVLKQAYCVNSVLVTFYYQDNESCPNGTINYPICTIYPSCGNGANNPPACNTFDPCTNGANNPPACNTFDPCTNGATNPPTCNACPTGASLQNGQCACFNGGVLANSCSCPSGQIEYNGKCQVSCSKTNVCGQSFQGVIVNNVCTPINITGDLNASCIQNFTVSTDSVNPNGSVEFTWKIAQVPGVGSRCGFVDLTTPTPRPIPGLQNLDTTVDKARITNIQATTRFCLVCQFYNLISNNTLGDTAVHQWVRVIRVGEN